jgi:rRNA maturation endonuclease Nob1
MGLFSLFFSSKKAEKKPDNTITCPYCNEIVNSERRNCPGCGNFISKVDAKTSKNQN